MGLTIRAYQPLGNLGLLQINRSSRAPLRKFEPFSGILEARIGLKRSKGFEIAPLRQKEDQRQMAGGRAIFKFLGKNLNSDTYIEVLAVEVVQGTYDRQVASLFYNAKEMPNP
ncbi:hypothetical protein HPP92_025536 [Vanilla planifolia]|uniref:Uncharacterized protein n=1 Tax=Vanilla planifolia TaxID=51239 RepID=A0A835PMH5_VANPL|nr:hypothetical protein HPP92_025536 [Vanilla planifolia]